MGSQQAEPSQARGGQHIALAHSQAFLELQYKKTAPLGFLGVVQSAMCTNSLRWELQSPWPFSRSALLIFKICWWTVQPSISSMLFKSLSHLCLTVLSFFSLFHAMSTPALHLIPSIQKRTVPMCRAHKTHCCTS